MPRRFDKRGWNRQFKNRPLRRGRWDPFPKEHLPFIDDFSPGMYALKATNESRGQKRKLPLDMDKESQKHNPETTPTGKRKRGLELPSPRKVAKGAAYATAGRQLFKSQSLQRALKRDFEALGGWVERQVGRVARRAGEGIVEAEDAMGLEAGSMFSWIGREAAALEEPLLAAGTELAEFALLL